MKRCSDCGELKPLDDYHKNKAYKDGHRPVCKACRSIEYYRTGIYFRCEDCGTRIRKKDTVSTCSYCLKPKKVCESCGEEKLLTKYYQNRGAKDGRQNTCIVCRVKRNGRETTEFIPRIPREMVASMYRKKHP